MKAKQVGLTRTQSNGAHLHVNVTKHTWLKGIESRSYHWCAISLLCYSWSVVQRTLRYHGIIWHTFIVPNFAIPIFACSNPTPHPVLRHAARIQHHIDPCHARTVHGVILCRIPLLHTSPPKFSVIPSGPSFPKTSK